MYPIQMNGIQFPEIQSSKDLAGLAKQDTGRLRKTVKLVKTIVRNTLDATKARPHQMVFLAGFKGSHMVSSSGKTLWGTLSAYLRHSNIREVSPLTLGLSDEDEDESCHPDSAVRVGKVLTKLSLPGGRYLVDMGASLFKEFKKYESKFVLAMDDESSTLVIKPASLQYPYDWRRGLERLAGELLQFAIAYKEETGKELTISAHSTGCLVALMAWYKAPEGVFRAFVFYGGPFQGCAMALPGYCSGDQSTLLNKALFNEDASFACRSPFFLLGPRWNLGYFFRREADGFHSRLATDLHDAKTWLKLKLISHINRAHPVKSRHSTPELRRLGSAFSTSSTMSTTSTSLFTSSFSLTRSSIGSSTFSRSCGSSISTAPTSRASFEEGDLELAADLEKVNYLRNSLRRADDFHTLLHTPLSEAELATRAPFVLVASKGHPTVAGFEVTSLENAHFDKPVHEWGDGLVTFKSATGVPEWMMSKCAGITESTHSHITLVADPNAFASAMRKIGEYEERN
ncbi:hypothetical protein T439DRAFT_361172 [Meredithblackwellia eburnea MCA 4105]